MRFVYNDVVLSLVDVGCLFKGIGSFHQIVIPEGEGVFRHFAIQQVLIAGVGGHEDPFYPNNPWSFKVILVLRVLFIK